MNRNPRFWTRRELAKLDYMYTVMDLSLETLSFHYDKTENAIKIQLDRLTSMHERTGTSYNDWS